MKLLRSFLPAMAVAAFIIQSPAATFYVDVNGTNPIAPYADWSTAATNIQDAIDVANDGDLVLVTNGVYRTGGRTVYTASTNRVVISRAVTVQSVNGPAVTSIEGTNGARGFPGGGMRCVFLTNGATLSGFTLTNGAAASGDPTNGASGGAVWCQSLSATVDQLHHHQELCVFQRRCGLWRHAGELPGGDERGVHRWRRDI